MYKHADQHAHKYACVNTRTYIKPDDEEVITARLSKRLYPLISLRSIMMIKTLHECMHVSMCSCMDGWLHMSKGVQACRPAYMHACMCKHMQVHIQPDIQKRLYLLVFTMIDHDDQNPSCMHACQHLLMHGWLVIHTGRIGSRQQVAENAWLVSLGRCGGS